MGFAGGFWATVELLVALDATSQSHPFEDDVEDWLENVSSKVKMQLKNVDDSHRDVEEESAFEDNVDYGNLIDCSFTYSPVRSRLEYLMGSNVVRLTDRKYMLKLIARIRQDHENKQDIRVQERKMQELMRTKNMILSRFIPVEEAPAEIFEYPLFQLYMYCDSLMEKKRRKRIKKVKMSKSLYQLLYPEKLETELADEEEMDEVPMKEVMIDGEPQLVPLSKEEIEAMAKEKETALEIKNGYMFTKEEYENLHYEADAIKKLKETKTVNEMYAKAHEIVGFCFSLVGEPRNRCTQDEEMMPLSEVQSKIESASHASSKASKATSKASKARSRK